MKILYLCTFYHVALLYSQLKKGLEKKGYTIHVFNTAKYNTVIGEKYHDVINDPDVVHLECWNSIDRLFFFPRQWKIQKSLEKSYSISEYDLLHAHLLLSSGYTVRRLKKKYGIKYIVSVRKTDLTGFIKFPFFKNLARKIAADANGILFLSKSHKEEFLTKYILPSHLHEIEEKCIVIGNPLEKFWEQHTVSVSRSLKKNKELNILFVGTIDKNKNIPTIAEAILILKKEGYNINFTVVGEVIDESEKQKLDSYGFITRLPYMEAEKLLYVYRSSDIFVMPSIHETFGRVYIEAMSQGLPIIYSKGQGFDGIYPDGEVGFSVFCNDPKFIADRILDIEKDYSRLSKNCIIHVRDFYEDVIIDKLNAFYKNSIA